jgi:DNA-binding GntR family transcriptional regulator
VASNIRMPKYHRIAEAIRADVCAGNLQAGDRLPAETSIADQHGASVPTVRQAMSVLRAEGLIESRHGIGTFVRSRSRLQRRSRNRYGDARGRAGLLTDSLRHDVTYAGPEPAPPGIAEAIGIEPGETVIVRRRDLYDDAGELQEIGASYLPREYAEDTFLAKPTVVPKALFRCVEDITGRRYTHATDQWVSRAATVHEAERFAIPIGSYVLHLTHVARDAASNVIEVSESTWPADRVAFIDDYDIPAEPADPDTKSDV